MLQMMRWTCESEQEYLLQQTVHQKLRGPHRFSPVAGPGPAVTPCCTSTLLVDLVAEMTQISNEIIVALPGTSSSRAPGYVIVALPGT